MGSRLSRPHCRPSLFRCTDPNPVAREKAHDFAPFAGLTAATRSGGGWSKDGCPHLALNGRAPDDRLVENRTKVRSWVAEVGLLPSVQGARMVAPAFRAHLDRTRRAFRSQRSGHFAVVAIPIQLHTTVFRYAVRSSIHDHDGQFLRSQSGELQRSHAWAGRSTACMTDRLPLDLGGPVLMGRCLVKRQRRWLLAAMMVEAQPLLR
jgi:hypothetical protein